MPWPGSVHILSQLMGLQKAIAGIEAQHTAAISGNFRSYGKRLCRRQHNGMRTAGSTAHSRTGWARSFSRSQGIARCATGFVTDHGGALAERAVLVQPKAHNAVRHKVGREQISTGPVDHANRWSTTTAAYRVQLASRGAFDGESRDDVLSINPRAPAAGIQHASIRMYRQIEWIGLFGRKRDVAGTAGGSIERKGIETAAHVAGTACAETSHVLARCVSKCADDDAMNTALRKQKRRPAQEHRCAGAKQRSTCDVWHRVLLA